LTDLEIKDTIAIIIKKETSKDEEHHPLEIYLEELEGVMSEMVHF
jgi:hypothetical protein